MKRYIVYIIATLFAISCSKENSPIIEQEEVRDVAFNMMTKAGDESRTYCFALYSTNQNIVPQYGFYTSEIINSADKKDQYQWLTPIEENGHLGLAASVGLYSLLAVTPAVVHTSAESYLALDLSTGSKIEKITKKIYGYPYNRVPVPDCDYDQLFVGDSQNIYIEGVLASTAPDETAYNYTFDDDYKLKKQRTKFQLKARAGSITDENGQTTQLSYNISSIYISDVVNSAIFNPTVGYYATDVIDNLYPFTKFQDDGDNHFINWSESKALDVIGTENIDSDNNFYLISADYSNRERYPITPTLKVEFKNSSGSIRTVPIMLDINFKPQHYYTFDLLISSIEITLSITVEDWDKHDVTDDVLDLSKSTITVSIEDENNWETGGAINGDIGDIINNE